jgi:SPP1 family predicted phage head-tail adaptor
MIFQRKKKVVFQTNAAPNASISDGMGGYTSSWSDTITHYMEIRPLSANETFEAGKLEHSLTHRLFGRYRSGITPDMRIKYRDHRLGSDRYFDIVQIMNKGEASVDIEILATEAKDD